MKHETKKTRKLPKKGIPLLDPIAELPTYATGQTTEFESWRAGLSDWLATKRGRMSELARFLSVPRWSVHRWFATRAVDPPGWVVYRTVQWFAAVQAGAVTLAI